MVKAASVTKEQNFSTPSGPQNLQNSWSANSNYNAKLHKVAYSNINFKQCQVLYTLY